MNIIYLTIILLLSIYEDVLHVSFFKHRRNKKARLMTRMICRYVVYL
jgi:hypothetical protein